MDWTEFEVEYGFMPTEFESDGWTADEMVKQYTQPCKGCGKDCFMLIDDMEWMAKFHAEFSVYSEWGVPSDFTHPVEDDNVTVVSECHPSEIYLYCIDCWNAGQWMEYGPHCDCGAMADPSTSFGYIDGGDEYGETRMCESCWNEEYGEGEEQEEGDEE